LLLGAGWTAREVVDALTTRDQGRDWRQLIVINRFGHTAGATGSSNEAALGLIQEENLAIAGNMLANDKVLPAMKEAYQRAGAQPLAVRLLVALIAGETQAVTSAAPALRPCWLKTTRRGRSISAWTWPPIRWRFSTIF